MPSTSRFFIKAGVIFMVASLFAAILATAPAAWNLPRWANAVGTTHFHLFTVGWITQIIFGVALWLFPRWSKEAPRGPEWLGWACFGTLNVGLVLRALSETGMAMGHTGGLWAWTMSTAALLQWLAAAIFAGLIWPRVQPQKTRKPKKTREKRNTAS